MHENSSYEIDFGSGIPHPYDYITGFIFSISVRINFRDTLCKSLASIFY